MVKEVNASHILVKSEDKAKSLLNEIQNGGNFAEIAKRDSLCPSGNRKGGNLGWFTRGKMAREFENACFRAKKGDLIGPVKTHFGYHIIKINNTR